MAEFENCYSVTLNGYEVETHQEALDYAMGMCWGECDKSTQTIGYYTHIGSVNGIDVYYDYGADYYFFCEEEEGL